MLIIYFLSFLSEFGMKVMKVCSDFYVPFGPGFVSMSPDTNSSSPMINTTRFEAVDFSGTPLAFRIRGTNKPIRIRYVIQSII